MSIRRFERYFKSIISGRKKGRLASFIKSVLLPVSWLYHCFSKVRNWLYDQDWMRCYIAPVPLVLSVGNIVAGGTGKTPLILLLLQELEKKYLVAVLCRGYRSKAETLKQPTIVCKGTGPLVAASDCGDEAHLYALKFPKTIVIAGRNRKEAAKIAFGLGAQILLLDDALQHRKLNRDFDLVVMDANDPFGQQHLLPRGYLREEVKELKRADLIILNHVTDLALLQKVKKQVELYSSAPIVATRYRITKQKTLDGSPLASLKNVSVGLFCSIANPDYFKQLLVEQGATILAEHFLADHEEIKEKSLLHFAKKCLKKGCQWLVCTEKDLVKLSGSLNKKLPIATIEIELEIVEGEEKWRLFLENALQSIK